MNMDVQKTASSIMELSGSKDNIAKATHCVTRLRLVVKDETAFQKEEIEGVEG